MNEVHNFEVQTLQTTVYFKMKTLSEPSIFSIKWIIVPLVLYGQPYIKVMLFTFKLF